MVEAHRVVALNGINRVCRPESYQTSLSTTQPDTAPHAVC